MDKRLVYRENGTVVLVEYKNGKEVSHEIIVRLVYASNEIRDAILRTVEKELIASGRLPRIPMKSVSELGLTEKEHAEQIALSNEIIEEVIREEKS